ncbi:MAG: type I-U CRISPR-associated protein Csx17 [Phycisphaerae bacterium]|nr:type I-U CRISPR-associated protein Csx17 [Phycisphaerae bacterium]
MPEATHEVVLSGCTPEPLMNYLKALGVLRLVAEDREHGDPNARGSWRNDVFVLSSRIDKQGIEDLFVNHYTPTPILAPWAGGSGFFSGDNTDFADALVNAPSGRCDRYREAIKSVRAILKEEKVEDKPTDETKSRLLRRYRASLSEQLVQWMDSALIIQQDGQSFAPILGTGGNDGRLDFTQNFMRRLSAVGITDAKPTESAGHWLKCALFGVPTPGLQDAAVGQFSPGHAGGPNATQGMEGDPTDNPWDFVLMLEGSLVFAGAAARRLGAASDSRAAFPFTVRAVDVGFTSAGRDDSSDARGELWLPLWKRASTYAEIVALFSEGRAEVHGRAVRDAVDFARAAATLGVDRGIGVFTRVSLLKRSGKAYLAAAEGRVTVAERPDADLLREIDPWLDRFRLACSGDGVPARFTSALRAIDSAIFDFCQYGGQTHFQPILTALGAAEREMALTPGKIGQSKTIVQPLAGLSSAWIAAANAPDNGEFEIALALAGIDDPTHAIGPLRSNLESVTIWRDAAGRIGSKWAEKDRAVVWSAADLSVNLAAVLDRRVMDAGRKRCADLPLASPSAASPASIAAFLRDELDDRTIEALLWGLMLIDRGTDRGSALPGADAGDVLPPALPPIYALLKLLFLPRPLLASRAANGAVRWRLANANEKGVPIRPEPAILSLLRAGRVGDAAAIAMRRLRSSGLNPLPHRRSGGPSRDGEWSEVRLSPREGQRLAAALLIPIRADAVNALVQQATRADIFDDPSEVMTTVAVQ